MRKRNHMRIQLLLYLSILLVLHIPSLAQSRVNAPKKVNVYTMEKSESDSIIQDLKEYTLTLEYPNPQGPDQVSLFSFPLEKFEPTSGFGYRINPVTMQNSFHSGLDLKAMYQEVFSMLHGVILKTGYTQYMGKFVTIKHGFYSVTYGHLSVILKQPGDILLPGEVIGISGNSGRSTGPHLHLSVQKGDNSINPLIFINQLVQVTQKEQLIEILTQ